MGTLVGPTCQSGNNPTCSLYRVAKRIAVLSAFKACTCIGLFLRLHDVEKAMPATSLVGRAAASANGKRIAVPIGEALNRTLGLCQAGRVLENLSPRLATAWALQRCRRREKGCNRCGVQRRLRLPRDQAGGDSEL